MQITRGLVEFIGEGQILHIAHAVLAGDGAAKVKGDAHEVVERENATLSGLAVTTGREDRGMQVAVTGVTECADAHVALGGHILEPRHGLGQTRARHTHIVEQPIADCFDSGNGHAACTDEKF